METMNIPSRKKKSEPLSQDEWKSLKQYRKGFHTEMDCAEAIGITREALGRVILLGRSSPETVTKIRTALGQSTLK